MCPRIRRMILVAVLGVVGGAGTASAQAPQVMPSKPSTVPPVSAPIIATPTPAQPAPAPAIPAPRPATPVQPPLPAPAPVPATPMPAPVPHAQPLPAPHAPYATTSLPVGGGCRIETAPPTVATDYYGSSAPCSDCSSGSSGSASRSHRFGGGLFGRAAIGEGCANPVGCGNCASEKTFLFGSCNQFFNPGNDCGNGGFLSRLCGGNCAVAPVGTGGLSSPPCTYTSYLNR